jgi:hypothetical protein
MLKPYLPIDCFLHEHDLLRQVETGIMPWVQNGFTEYFGGFEVERVLKLVRNETRLCFTLERSND